MCGIVGMISKRDFGFVPKDTEMFNQMLYADALRGKDSTGVFGVNEHGNLKMIKAAQPAGHFQDTKTYEDFQSDIFSTMRMVVGHNRAATRGAKTDTNAHPFIEDNICLIHNGTLHSHRELADDVEVDSHAITKSIAKRGYKETMPKINGAYALIWYDAEKKRLFISRNNQRPLWLVDTKDTIYIASEAEMLMWLHKRVFGTTAKVAYFKEDHIYHWDLGQKEDVFGIEETPKAKKIIPLATPPATPMVISSAGKTGSTKYLYKHYAYGDRIFFEHIHNSVYANRATFHGVTIDNEETKVSGIVDIAHFDDEQVKRLVDQSDYMTGKICGISVRNNVTTLMLTDIKVEDTYETCTGEVIFESDVRDLGYSCSECGGHIDLDIENTQFWARIKNGIVKKLLCAFCVESKPHLHRRS